MHDEVCGCVVEELLKQFFSCADLGSWKKIIEIGKPAPFITKNSETIAE
jgi:hypothetical protein